MSNLLQLQNQFQHYLLEDANEFQQHVISTEKVSAETRLSIYREAYQARLIDALNSNYPMLYEFLGTEIFTELAADYIQQHPSTYRSIRWFGDQLPAFLNDHPDYKMYAYLTELAEFEWAQALAFDAADAVVLTIADIQTIAPEVWQDMHFLPHPSVNRLNFSWNVVPLWQAMMDDLAIEDPVETTLPTAWIVWRHDLINQYAALENDEACVLDAILNGKSFGDMCEILCEWTNEDEVGLRAASLLSTWIQLGLFSEVQFKL
jgi:hypothetical protein